MRLFASFLILGFLLPAGAAARASQPEEWTDLAAPEDKNRIDDRTYFTYEFTTPPRMGTVILKVQVFDASGKKSTAYSIQAECGMPSMSGAHDSGPQVMSLNKAGNYLLPLNLVMPGEWEIKLVILKGDHPVFRGRARFDV